MSYDYELRIYGYVYVVNDTQTFQDVDLIKRYRVNPRDIFFDQGSREAIKILNEHILLPGDTLFIANIQTLGTNKNFILEELNYLYSNEINVFFIENNELNVNLSVDEKLDLVEAALINIENEKKRQATINGIYNMPVNENGARYSMKTFNQIGRPKIQIPENFTEVYSKWKDGELSSNEAMEKVGLKRTTFYNMVKEYENMIENN